MRLCWRAKRHGRRDMDSALGQRSTVQIGQIGHRVNALVQVNGLFDPILSDKVLDRASDLNCNLALSRVPQTL